jgi:hypothetical protein
MGLRGLVSHFDRVARTHNEQKYNAMIGKRGRSPMTKETGFGKMLPTLISWGPENIPPHTRDHVRTMKIMADFYSRKWVCQVGNKASR